MTYEENFFYISSISPALENYHIDKKMNYSDSNVLLQAMKLILI